MSIHDVDGNLRSSKIKRQVLNAGFTVCILCREIFVHLLHLTKLYIGTIYQISILCKAYERYHQKLAIEQLQV
jgi:hypothetical protein